MDYRAIARAITDPENQPHQWNNQELSEFFVSAADEIERLREALKVIANSSEEWGAFAQEALQQKESE